jgi:biopolymer transport protein ExbD
MASRSQDAQSIDIAPLIDVVFILLIFFMVSTTFNRDLKLDLSRPRAASGVISSSKAIRVLIDRAQRVFLDNQPIRLWVLRGKLSELLRSSPTKAVLVITDENVPSQRLVEVVDQCRLAGASEVGVATDSEDGARP